MSDARDCPICGENDTVFGVVEEHCECKSCGVLFATDNEILANWTHCTLCGTYTAPEDRTSQDDPTCIRCERKKTS